MPSPDAFDDPTDTERESIVPDIDDAFLASLPEHLRQEVLDQPRADQLRRTGGLEVSAQAKTRLRQRQKGQQQESNTIDSYFLPPPRRPKASFMKKYSDIEELREVIMSWVKEFTDEAPYAEDVDALTSYLTKVVLEERDLNKAVKVAKWLDWTVGREVRPGQEVNSVNESWSQAVLRVKESVQSAVKKRGLGQVDLG